jgi:hypothetical protein
MTTIQKPAGPQQASAPVPDLVPMPTPIPNGEAIAAFIAAGIGCLAIGMFTTLNDAYTGVSTFLNLDKAVGPLSGKVMYGLLVWLISWAVLYVALRGKQISFNKGFVTALVLVGLGLLGTFPTVFEFIADTLSGK